MFEETKEGQLKGNETKSVQTIKTCQNQQHKNTVKRQRNKLFIQKLTILKRNSKGQLKFLVLIKIKN